MSISSDFPSALKAGSVKGQLRKMASQYDSGEIAYSLVLADGDSRQKIPLNALLGQQIRLSHTGRIYCVECGRATKKSFNQGFCYPCFSKLAACDTCMMDPVTCHYDQGTCREPEWAETVCMSDHLVYLSLTSSVKVGITRITQMPTRWIDQGATQALAVMRTRTRHQAGCIEDVLRKSLTDRTAWQKMLKGNAEEQNLRELWQALKVEHQDALDGLTQRFGLQAFEDVSDSEDWNLHYPVLKFPTKVTSFNFDKQPEVAGQLLGIKGQYWILDTGVINLRKFGGYEVEVVCESPAIALANEQDQQQGQATTPSLFEE
ncbi:DUF2797 domain-containing protein [Pokkaliibacter sp. CJK22405]|uniref:DUF2797 domain-containing protein n=1 Tax=Pokkaliibacter sp. CJK22405 TaxID=3384615 RepID=UPI0039850D9E